jgi:zinc transport system substrate-binding protein
MALGSVAAVLVLGASCSAEVPEEDGDGLGVVVTILPQAEFVTQTGGENVNVSVMIPPGASPHTYEPSPSQMTTLAAADMYAKVGSGLEFELAWMGKLVGANRDMLVVDCSEGIELLPMDGEQHSAADGPHSGRMDPHIWMSPLNAMTMVRNICAGLTELDPQRADLYERNRDRYVRTLSELDAEIRQTLANTGTRAFMVYHPSFGYFAHEYGLTMIPIEEEGKEPTPAALKSLIGEAEERNIRVIFASPQFNPQTARVIADAIGGRVVFVDPLARDYVENLREFLHQLVEASE